jgi:hypothetical protein
VQLAGSRETQTHTPSKNPHNIVSKNTQYKLLPQWKLHISHKILSLREDTTYNIWCGWKNNVRMDEEEIRCYTEWIHLAEDRVL